MPHQDKDDLRTPLHELKESLAPLAQAQLENVSQHGNSTLGGLGIAVLALLTFGWSRQRPLGERFATAHQASQHLQHLLGGSAIAGSHQALRWSWGLWEVAQRANPPANGPAAAAAVQLAVSRPSDLRGRRQSIPRAKNKKEPCPLCRRRPKKQSRLQKGRRPCKSQNHADRLSRWFVSQFS